MDAENSSLVANFNGYVNMEIEFNGRKYMYCMPMGAPYSDCFEVALKMSDAVLEFEKKNKPAESSEESLNSSCAEGSMVCEEVNG